jgi:two-component system, LytTR family, sensor histidine kinase AlgZ
MLDDIPAMTGEDSIVRATLRALLVPRRLLPILLVSITMVFAQRAYSRDPRAAFVGIAMCLSFVLVAPVSFRVLFPEGLEFSHGAVRLLIYAAITVLTVLVVGVYFPLGFGIGTTFLTARSSLLIDTVLFLVGGWGLGRDIGMEASLTQERKRTTALTREAEHAQLLALRAQLDPHFLFNTLNAIAEWCRTDGETAERAVLELASLLRAVLTGVKQPSWPLEQELALVRTLLALHLRRDPEMFVLHVDVAPEVQHVPIPPMILVPLAENAVKHGPGRGHRGTIDIVVTARDGGVHVAIANPGKYTGPRAGSHGLPITERRLALAYDGRAALHVHGDGDGARTIAEVTFPTDGPQVTT